MPHEDQYVRSVAGLTLKNNIRSHFPLIPPSVVEYIKGCSLQHIGDPQVGKAVGIVIAAIVERGQVHNWIQALQVLMEKLDDPDTTVGEVFIDIYWIREMDERDYNMLYRMHSPLCKRFAKIVHVISTKM